MSPLALRLRLLWEWHLNPALLAVKVCNRLPLARRYRRLGKLPQPVLKSVLPFCRPPGGPAFLYNARRMRAIQSVGVLRGRLSPDQRTLFDEMLAGLHVVGSPREIAALARWLA